MILKIYREGKNMSYRKQPKERSNAPKEEYAIILDVIFDNHNSFNNSEIAQAVGATNFTLLELVPKQGVILKPSQKVYIGDGKREEIQYIKRSLFPDKLTNAARNELTFSLMDLIDEREVDFINFFNNAGPITIRKHSLELIPGIGKKHLKDLIESREEKKFESFDDIKKRCHFLADPQKAIAERIVKEIEDAEEFKLFVKK